jgi:hypothetical protein
MGDTWIVDITHFLDEDGCLVPQSGPALKLAEHIGSIVAMVSAGGSPRAGLARVPCRRRPGRKKCPGEIVALIEADTDAIVWHCPNCGDNGLIARWRDTLWDLSSISSPH